MGQQPPHTWPAPHATPISSTVAAPPAMARSTSRSVVPRHEQTYTSTGSDGRGGRTGDAQRGAGGDEAGGGSQRDADGPRVAVRGPGHLGGCVPRTDVDVDLVEPTQAERGDEASESLGSFALFAVVHLTPPC